MSQEPPPDHATLVVGTDDTVTHYATAGGLVIPLAQPSERSLRPRGHPCADCGAGIVAASGSLCLRCLDRPPSPPGASPALSPSPQGFSPPVVRASPAGVPCCPCNAKGTKTGSQCKDRRCPCAKEGVRCTSCVPCSLGNCANATASSSTSRPPLDPATSPVRPLPPPSAASPPPANDSFAREKLREAFGAEWLNSPGPSAYPEWERRHKRVVRLRSRYYTLPQGNVGRKVVDAVTAEINALAEGRSPSERVLVLLATLLQRDMLIKNGPDIRKTILRRLGMWERGEFEQLLREAERSDSKWPTQTSAPDETNRFRLFDRKVKAQQLHSANRLVTSRDQGGVLDPLAQAEGESEGVTVLDVLQRKHPAQQPADPAAFIDCDDLPPFEDVDITEQAIERTARALHGSGGPAGGDSELWQALLLRHGAHSARLRGAVAALTRRLANSYVPWEEFRALKACRLVGLDKQPGVRPIGIGEVLCRLMAKTMAALTGYDLQLECGVDQLCTGVKAGIEGAVHAMAALFDDPATEGMLLVDASNAFNRMSRPAALYNCRVLWPRCSRFLFNTYNGHAALHLAGSPDPLWSQEGTTQGDPLAMLMYAGGILPLVRRLRDAGDRTPVGAAPTSPDLPMASSTAPPGPTEPLGAAHTSPDLAASLAPPPLRRMTSEGPSPGPAAASSIFTDPSLRACAAAAVDPTSPSSRRRQCWYADDSSALGRLHSLFDWFSTLRRDGPAFGYHPEPKKSYLVVKPGLEAEAERLFGPFGVRIVSGRRFLGGYVGDAAGRRTYLSEKVEGWVQSVKALSAAATRYPQSAHAALTKSLQNEWDYVARTVPSTDEDFAPLRASILHDFVPAIFGQSPSETDAPILLAPVRQGGIGVRDPLVRRAHAHRSSVEGTTVVANAITTGRPLDLARHAVTLGHSLAAGRKAQEAAFKATIAAAVSALPPKRQRPISRCINNKTGAWLNVMPSPVDQTDLSAHEFRDNINLRYGLTPPELPPRCPCGALNSVEHALDCKVGGAIIRRHDDNKGRLADLSRKGFGATAVQVEQRLSEGTINTQTGQTEGGVIADITVRGVWEKQTVAAFDLCVFNADAPSYARTTRPVHKLLEEKEKAKKRHYRAVCEELRMHFTPLIATVDGVWGREAEHFFKRLAAELITKEGWKERSFAQVSGWVRSRMSCSLARACSMCLRGGRVLWRGLECDDGAGVGLA